MKVRQPTILLLFAALICAMLHGAGEPFEMTGQIMMIADTAPRRLHIIAETIPNGCCVWDMTEPKAKCSSGDLVKVAGFLDKSTGAILREASYPVANYATNITVVSNARFPETISASAQYVSCPTGSVSTGPSPRTASSEKRPSNRTPNDRKKPRLIRGFFRYAR